MKTTRRKLLGLGAAAIGAATVSPRSVSALGAEEAKRAAGGGLTNWAGNYTYSVDTVHRGGSFNDGPRHARSSLRADNQPTLRVSNIGVRPARRLD